jgi:dTMP kinase
MSRWATNGLRPDLTILLDIPAEIGLARASGRSQADKLEGESLDFHRRVRQAFRALAESSPRQYLVIDAGRTPAEIAAEIREAVEALVPRKARLRPVPPHAEVAAETVQEESA